MLYSNEQRNRAKEAYLSQMPVPVIAREQGIPKRTLYYWIKLYEWDELPVRESVEQVLDRLIIKLLNRKSLTLDAVEMIERIQAAKEREIKFKLLKQKAENNPVPKVDKQASSSLDFQP